MTGCNYALAKLHHMRALQNLPKLRLAYQEALQQGLIAILKIGKHAQFLNCTCCQILCFVHDEKAAFSLGGHTDQKSLKGHQYVRFGDVLGAQAEGCAYQSEGVICIELRTYQLCSDDFVWV